MDAPTETASTEPAVRALIPIAQPSIGERELELVTAAIRSGWVSSIGEYVAAFEAGLADACGVRHAITVSNGTVALHLALAVAGIGPGDEVIVPSMTFVATAAAVRYVGATPVFADSDPEHWCISPSDVARRITTRTRAIVPVHLYGHPADMDALAELTRGRDILLIEDAAEALGAEYRDRPAGSLGTCGVLSFYGNKLITTGEGGAIVTSDDAFANRARHLRDHAMDPHRRYWHDEVGFNFRLTNLQAALGVAQLERLEELLTCKRAIEAAYRDGFADLPNVRLQEQSSWASSSCWMPTIQLGPGCPVGRDELAVRLRGDGIDTRPTFVPLHELPPYRDVGPRPVAEAIGREGLSLPSDVSLSSAELEHVVSRVRHACAHG